MTRPELTDAFVKQQLNASSVDTFKKEIRESMLRQEVAMEDQRRERLLMDEIVKCTKVELAPELVDEEMQQILGEFEQQLSHQNLTVEQWLGKSGKKPEEFLKEIRAQGEKRLTLRLGMQALIEEKKIDITDEEMTQIVEEFLGQANPEQRRQVAPAYQKGAEAYEQLKWQKKVEKALSNF